MAIELRPEQMRADLIKSLNEYKHYFEVDWDYDPDLLSGDQEREHYAWTIAKLEEYGQVSRPNYLDKIDSWEQELPSDKKWD